MRPFGVGACFDSKRSSISWNLAFLAVLTVTLGVSASHAQSTPSNLADFLASGGRKLSSDDAEAILTGTRVTLSLPAGAVATVQFKADGTFSGVGEVARGQSGVFGKWTFENHLGRLCSEIHFSRGLVPTQTHCYYVFMLRDRLFLSYNESGDSQVYPFEKR